MSGHAEREHARCSASGAERWIPCPGSVALGEFFGEQRSSFADEGTAAHELAELRLMHDLGRNDGMEYEIGFDAFLDEKGHFYGPEMDDHVTDYVDTVMERINAARAVTPDALVLLEKRVDFSRWVPEGFGSCDVTIVAGDYLEVIDLKYGQGVAKSAVGNPQLRLYALGALDEYELLYPIERVRMTIVQPRLGLVTEEVLQVDELLHWADEVVVPQARKAFDGVREYQAGEHCKFCPARHSCRTRGSYYMQLEQFSDRSADLLTPAEIGDVLQRGAKLSEWLGHIQSYATGQALKGERFPGWKLVQADTKRKIGDQVTVSKLLLGEKLTKEQILKVELKGITDLTKLLGKKRFEELVGPHIIKPQGAPTLVPVSDKRPELATAAAAAEDFADEF